MVKRSVFSNTHMEEGALRNRWQQKLNREPVSRFPELKSAENAETVDLINAVVCKTGKEMDKGFIAGHPGIKLLVGHFFQKTRPGVEIPGLNQN